MLEKKMVHLLGGIIICQVIMHIWSAESCFIYICPSSQQRASHDTTCRAGLAQTLLSSTGKLLIKRDTTSPPPANTTVSGKNCLWEGRNLRADPELQVGGHLPKLVVVRRNDVAHVQWRNVFHSVQLCGFLMCFKRISTTNEALFQRRMKTCRRWFRAGQNLQNQNLLSRHRRHIAIKIHITITLWIKE